MSTPADLLRSGLSYHQQGNLLAAEQIYLQVVAASPKHGAAHHLSGVAALQMGRPADAVARIQTAIDCQTPEASWLGNLGTALCALKRLDDALVAYDRALEIDPKFADAWFNKGTTFRQLSQLSDAESAFQNALAINPDHIGTLNNLGTLLRELNRSPEAAEVLQKATLLPKATGEAWYNYGNAMRDLGQIDKQLDALRQADRLAPNMPRIRSAIGLAQLSLWQYPEGWAGYEWRLQSEGGGVDPKCRPRWDGSALNGKSIALFAEQGFGDTLQFVRFGETLQQSATGVFLVCPKPLIPLLSRCRGFDVIVSDAEQLPAFDVAAPLLSVGHFLKLTPDNIPSDRYLSADPQRVEAWAQRFTDQSDDRPARIGIAWQGAADFPEDCRRSAPLRAFAPLAQAGAELVSLQKGFGSEQIADCGFAVTEFSDLDETGGAFEDTAALMQSLDLVVTVDTSIGHVAGGLGVPTWIALSPGADWRWGSGRSDSPWYSSVTLFRQSSPGDWASVFEGMAGQLPGLAAATTQTDTVPKSEPQIAVPISPGELLDKITILQIKNDRIEDQAKLTNVRFELESLNKVVADEIASSPTLESLIAELKTINEQLWDIEDNIRNCEAAADFGETFVNLARSVYITNDERSRVKREINVLLGSSLVEEKSYADYRRKENA